MPPEDNPADDVQPTKEEWDAYEAGRPISDLEACLLEIKRLRSLLWVRVLCGGCGKRYSYNRADDPDGKLAGAKHECG